MVLPEMVSVSRLYLKKYLKSTLIDCIVEVLDKNQVTPEHWIEAEQGNWPEKDSTGGDEHFYLYHNYEDEGRLFNLKDGVFTSQNMVSDLKLSFKVTKLRLNPTGFVCLNLISRFYLALEQEGRRV